MIRIKICGLTDSEEAKKIAEMGVHAIGMVFAKSPRQVDTETARKIVDSLPPFVQSVGVFVNEEVEKIKEIVDSCGLDLVQLHGEEGPEVCKVLYPRSIKAWRIKSIKDIEKLIPYEKYVRGFLLDAYSEKAYGGTGLTFDWKIALEARKRLSRPVILAGGLNPENCREAVELVQPRGIDISSGVEIAPGKKNIKKVQAILDALKFNCTIP